MGLTGCYAVLKYIVFLLNLVFWVSGLTVIFLSVWMLFDPTFYISMAQDESSYYSGVCILFLAGTLLFVVGFLGCFGAYKESPKLLILFFCGLLLILVAQISAGVWAYSNKDKLQQLLRYSVTYTIEKEYGQVDSQQRTASFDAIQRELKCCGAYGPEDWRSSSWKGEGSIPKLSPTSSVKPYEIPRSCCKPDFDEARCNKEAIIYGISPISTEVIYSKGCYKELSQKIEEYMNTVVVLTVGIGFIEFFGLIIALILCCAIRAVTKYK